MTKVVFRNITKRDFKECADGPACDMCLSYGVMANNNADEEYSHYISKEYYSEAFVSLFSPPIKVHLCRCCYQEQPAV